MADLYERLERVGFPSAYVRAHILPDWWEDELASELENRRLAEMAIARTLKLPLATLGDGRAELKVGREEVVRFKKWQDTEEHTLLPTVIVARRVCELLVTCAKLPSYHLEGRAADTLRGQILRTEPYVDLIRLVDLCWKSGVPIVHLEKLPTGARRVDGLALMAGGRPCIALLSQRKGPAWLIWPAAHEMGHVAKGHLRDGDKIDVEIDLFSESPDEREANDFAKALVYDCADDFKTEQVIPPYDLMREAMERGPNHRVHPGCIITNYGFNMKAWDVASAALKIAKLDKGGPDIIRSALLRHIDLGRLAETDRHFFESVTGLSE